LAGQEQQPVPKPL